MGKDQYFYNPKTLTYEKKRRTGILVAARILRFLLVFVVFAATGIILAYSFFDSPKERMLKREISQYEFQFTLLNDRLEQIESVLDNLQDKDDNIYRVIFEAEPIPQSQREAGFGGVDRYARLDGYKNSQVIIETTRRFDRITSQLVVQSKSFDEVFDLARNKSIMLTHIPAILPVEKGKSRIISGYGMRYHPILKVRRMHWGIDITATSGTPIYATADGKISFNGRKGGYGKTCMIDHGYGYQTLYGHMKTITVRRGQEVKRGEIIGYVGSTGLSQSPHVHYEVIYNEKKVNPVNYFYNDFTPEEFEKVLEIASRDTQVLS
jgi:murein DD-endopeptidase MepM/ murein hydrolase activator NlpD